MAYTGTFLRGAWKIQRIPKRKLDPPGRGSGERALWDHVVHVSDLISIHETFLPKTEDYVAAPRYTKRTSFQRRGRRRYI